MAKDSIFTWVLLGGAAYLAWNWWTSQPAAAAQNSGGSAPPCPSPGVLSGNTCTCPSPNTVVGGLCTAPPPPPAPTPKPIPTAAYSSTDQPWAMQIAAAANANTLDIDQWNYYFNNLANSTWKGILNPISGTQESAMLATLANLGLQESTPMTLPQWYWLVTAGGGGLSGFARFHGMGVVRIPVPLPGGRGMGALYTLGDLRRAGGR